MAEVELPFVVRSDSRESTQIVREDCPECGYDRVRWSCLKAPGINVVKCIACEHVIEAE